MHAPDAMPWYIAVPLAIFFTISYFVIRHNQNKKEHN
jgi:preprotein translocase subunit YajC